MTIRYGNNYDYGQSPYYKDEEGAAPPPERPIPVTTLPCEESETTGRQFWDYISTFWQFLSQSDREMFENFWDGLTKAGGDLVKKSQRFYDVTAPENARTCTLEDYYDIQIGPLHSKPINLDPTLKAPNNIIRAIDGHLIEPLYINEEPVYRDLIEISAVDYYKIRNIGYDNYVVVQVKRDDIADKYFKLSRLMSSEEPYGRGASIEITEEHNHDSSDTSIGRIRLTADDPSEDVSGYNVFVLEENIGGTSDVTWYIDGVAITVDPADKDVDTIVDLINASDPSKWATAKNISPKYKTDCPSFFDGGETYPDDAVRFDSLKDYLYNEPANGRYYPKTGDVWKWFEGYSSLDGDVGDPAIGEWVASKSKFKYMIEVEGNLDYIGEEVFTVYFTTGKVYDVDKFVLNLPVLQNFIDTSLGVPFVQDTDYRFYNNTIEFFDNLFETGRAIPNEYVYCPKALVIEYYLFEMYGTMVAVPDWTKFNYDRVSGKAAINSLLKSLQESSNRKDYQRALYVYYGLPVAPGKSEVLGLYESYEYKVHSIVGDMVTIDIPIGEQLHPFIQEYGRFMVDGKRDVIIEEIISRTTGEILMVGGSELSVGDTLYLRLDNRFAVKSFYMENLSTDTPGYIDVYIPEGDAIINYIIEVLQIVSNGEQFPEILIYGTEKLENNYNGIYHITNAEFDNLGKFVRLTVYQREDVDSTVYNDYIGITTQDVLAGVAHFPWPTHKFLHLLVNSSEYYKAYLDSPIDTIYDTGDILEKYDIIARNVSVLDADQFPGWNEFDHFRRFNKINSQSDIVELTYILPGAKFGEYFPRSYTEVPEL